MSTKPVHWPASINLAIPAGRRLLDSRPIFVHHIERDPDQSEALVFFRYKDNDVIWKAYFSPDGAVYVTDAEDVKVVYDARKYLTSKKMKWDKIR